MPAVLTNVLITINAVALKTKARKVTIDYSAAIFEAPAFADTGMRRVSGLKDAAMSFEFYRDEEASGVVQTLFGIVGTPVALAVRGVDTTIAATNAEYQMTGMLEDLPQEMSVDGVAMIVARFVQSDGVALIRDVT